MIEIKISNINESISRLVVLAGRTEALRLDIKRPMDEMSYYRQVAPVLAPMVRSDESYMYLGQERLRMTVEPVTGFMSCEGRSVVDIIRKVQQDGEREDDKEWSVANILQSAIDFEARQQEELAMQRRIISTKNEDLLREQEAKEEEDVERKLEREIIGTRPPQKPMTPLEAARRRAAQARKDA